MVLFKKMTEQQEHLKELLGKQDEIIQQIQGLNNEIIQKKEILLKVQGVIEYLQQIGITL